MIYTIELNDEEAKIVVDFTKKFGLNISDFTKQCMLDEIELSRQGAEAWAELERLEQEGKLGNYKLVPVENKPDSNQD